MAIRRERRGEAFWREVVAEWRRSGLSMAAFCRERELVPTTFYTWRRRVEPANGDEAFVPVHVVASSGPDDERCEPSLEVVVAGGRRVMVREDFDSETLQRVIMALETLPC